MPTTYEPKHLSSTPNGAAIQILPPNFVIVHTPPNATNVYDEVYINLYYTGVAATAFADVRLNPSDPNVVMQFHLVSGTVTPILRGHRISSGAYVAVANTTGGTLICFGSVNRITVN